MAEELFGNGITKTIVRQIIDAFMNRREVKTAKHAGALAFWRDGMLKQLDLIAGGALENETFAALKKNMTTPKS